MVTCSNPAAAFNSQVPSKDMQGSANTAHYITPPSTPVQYLVKLADFGLAREIDSKPPYTTYVSTRWYRAPEVLLRSGHYSAPVDMWAFGAMAVELATLKPLFPGSNEVDQVWRICEVMGSPGDWRDRAQNPVGGGPWEEGVRLAAELGFSFPKVCCHLLSWKIELIHQTSPRAMETILGKDWPLSMAKLLTELLYWNPAPRPTSIAALQHEFFQSAQSCPDPVGTPRVERSSIVPWMDLKAGSMGRHLSLHRGRDNIVQENEHLNARTSTSSHTDAKFPSAPRPIQRERIGKDEAVAGVQRQSWFSKKRDSLIGRSNAPVPIDMLKSEALSAVHQRRYTSKLVGSETITGAPKAPFPGSNHAPMPLLPPMLPISPIRDMTPVMAADRAPSRIANNSSAQYIHQQRAVHGRKIWHDDQAQSKAEPKGAIDLSRLSSVESNRHMSTENSTAVEQAPIPHEYSVVQPPRRGNNESASGFGNFLAHLRKKHKHAGPLDSSATRNTQDSSPLSAKSRTQVANEPRHLLESRSEKTTQKHVQSFMDHDHRGSGDDGKGTRLETSITTQRSGSTTRTRPIRITRQGPTSTDESYLISSRTKEGPVSSRTRLSAPQVTRTSDHVPCCQNDDTEYLDQELVSTALAMQKLDAFPAISPSSSNPKKGVPSYAKSTAASARRSSAINSFVTSSARRGMTRKTTSQRGFSQTHPPLPMNSLQRALF